MSELRQLYLSADDRGFSRRKAVCGVVFWFRTLCCSLRPIKVGGVMAVQVKVQYSDPAGSFLRTSAGKQVSLLLRHGHRPGTAEIDIGLPKAVRGCISKFYEAAHAHCEWYVHATTA